MDTRFQASDSFQCTSLCHVHCWWQNHCRYSAAREGVQKHYKLSSTPETSQTLGAQPNVILVAQGRPTSKNQHTCMKRIQASLGPIHHPQKQLNQRLERKPALRKACTWYLTGSRRKAWFKLDPLEASKLALCFADLALFQILEIRGCGSKSAASRSLQKKNVFRLAARSSCVRTTSHIRVWPMPGPGDALLTCWAEQAHERNVAARLQQG